jgi:hypothetical protein
MARRWCRACWTFPKHGSRQCRGQAPAAVLPLYLPHAERADRAERSLPGAPGDFITGKIARSRGAATPIRLVSSAKSWLCHPGVDRRAPFCRRCAGEVSRISPLTASTRYLSTCAGVGAGPPRAPFDQQDITVTIPASFDPAARELTAEACKAAGYQADAARRTQAALYSWIQASGGRWRKQVKPGDIILVVDVGGGTADLSLIAVLERDGVWSCSALPWASTFCWAATTWIWPWPMAWRASWRPTASSSMPGKPARWPMAAAPPRSNCWLTPTVQAVPVVVPSRGSKLIGGSIRTEVTHDAGHAGRWLFPQGGRQRQAQDPRARRSRSWACPMRRMRPSRAIWRPF